MWQRFALTNLMNVNSGKFNFDVGVALKSEKAKGLRISIIGLLLLLLAIPVYFLLEPMGQFLIAIGVLVGFVGIAVHIVLMFKRT